MKKRTSPIIGFILFAWFLLPIPLGLYISSLKADIRDKNTEIKVLREVIGKPVVVNDCQKEIAPTPTATPVERISPKKAPDGKQSNVWTGKVSHYSRAGCLGCSANLTMANGQPLDDEAMTIAFNWLPMNTRVKLTNLDNGKSCEATVTDTGGFNKLGRIADLVPAVARALETKTDISQVKIEVIN